MSPDVAAAPEWPAFRDAVRAAWAKAGSTTDARAALVGGVVEQGCPGVWSGPIEPTTPRLPGPLAVPEIAGVVLEALIGGTDRRARGAHHTPAPVARRLVELALDGLTPTDAEPDAVPTVCDPAVGGGAFLLAAARLLADRSHDPRSIVAGLAGCDIDPLAVATTIAALRWWSHDQTATPGRSIDRAGGPTGGAGAASLPSVEDRIRVGDGLAIDVATPGIERGVDLVVGNPPFLGQLRTVTTRAADARPGTGYADTAGLFLVAATALTRPGGRVALLQPESFLAARDAGPLRDRVLAAGALTDVWVAVDKVFGAAVRVCAPVVTVAGPQPDRVRLWRTAAVVAAGSAPAPTTGGSWGGLVAVVHGTPAVDLPTGAGVLGTIATATAGFRDQFYGLAPFVVEAPGTVPGSIPEQPMGALVTAGAIDPASCSWGLHSVRFAGERRSRPVVDLVGLAAADPALHRWVLQQLRPKVLVATQTKVVEAVADPLGRLVPSVPVVAVAPTSQRADDAWSVAAVLLAPPVSAWALQRAGGTALTADAIKLSAPQVREIPLPTEAGAWGEAALLLRAGSSRAEEFGALMLGAYGLAEDDPVLAWWLGRLPSWGGLPVG